MNILFWNINKKNLLVEIDLLAKSKDADIIVLAECEISYYDLLQYLNRDESIYFSSAGIGCERIKVLTKFKHTFSLPISEHNRWSIREIHPPLHQSFLLGLVHFPSKVNWTSQSQAVECGELVRQIESLENNRKHKRTILLGDFNMNPFEDGMISSGYFHATMDLEIAKSQKRVVQGKEYDYFYNPMWGFYGDLGKGQVSGTHYYNSSEHLNYKWNIYDQVLVRPQLLDEFALDELEIITESKESVYLTNKKQLNKKFSDHLPIKLTLNLNLK